VIFVGVVCSVVVSGFNAASASPVTPVKVMLGVRETEGDGV
jgi:hypothetical protein